jgi:hypothetical protein
MAVVRGWLTLFAKCLSFALRAFCLAVVVLPMLYVLWLIAIWVLFPFFGYGVSIKTVLESIQPKDLIWYAIHFFAPGTRWVYTGLYPTFLEIFEIIVIEIPSDFLGMYEAITSGSPFNELGAPKLRARAKLWASGYRCWNRNPFDVVKDLQTNKLSFRRWAFDNIPAWLIGLWTWLFWWPIR